MGLSGAKLQHRLVMGEMNGKVRWWPSGGETVVFQGDVEAGVSRFVDTLS